MKGAPLHVPLPQPTRERWQPLRIGLVELYHYDVEEFWFRDGHLLLRGNNGTGKSKVLSLTLPFLLDANLSASRVEPDGERSKRMEWNLLMNGRHPRRIGYTWMELGRCDSSGETHVLTLGCGLRAVAGRTSVDTWFFITDQRIGADLWLTTQEKTAVSRDRLEEAIGLRGQVFTTAQAYRRAVDERVFRLGSERYGALVDTLIQLRQPQLSKQPDERRLSDALTDALPPLDRTAIEDVAEAMSQLDDIRRELEELQAMHKAVTTFVARYRRYAQIATRRRARVLRQAQTEFDNASRELNEAQAELEEARRQVAHWQEQQREREELVAADAARLTVLTQDPVMRDAARIADARRTADRSRQIAREADERAEAARLRAEDETQATAERQETCGTTRANLLRSRHGAAAHATRGGVADAIEHALASVQIPDGVLDAPGDFVTRLLHTTRSAESRRREQISVVRQRLRALETATQSLARAQEARAMHADAFDSAREGLRTAIATLHSASTELLASSRLYCSALRVLELPNFDQLLDELEAWTESQSGPNPLRLAVDRAWQAWQEHTALREAALVEQQKKLLIEQRVLRDEQVKLMRGEDRVPPVPYTRAVDARLDRRGAPLWQLVDFEEHVPPESRAGLEAALEACGLLDAWVSPDGAVLDARTHDVMLVARNPCAQPLRNWLIATIPQSGHAAAVTSQTVTALLTSIACAVEEPPDVEAWLSPNGEFRVGTACGAWNKPRAEYIGHAARETARQARLAVLADDLAQIERMLAELDATAIQLSQARQTARSEYERAPADDDLQRAHARRAAQEQQRRDAQTRLGESDARLAQAQDALQCARDTLAADARDLSLPSDEHGIASVEGALGEFRVAVTELGNALSLHQRALIELAAQVEREQRATGDAETTLAERNEKRLLQKEADVTLATLEATVGKQVNELLQEIAAAESAKADHERALKDARAALLVAGSRRGTAEGKYNELNKKLAERVELRRHAINELQAFASSTGLLSAAAPELTLPEEVEWGVEAALTLARRAEQTLAEVAADDADWTRIQASISRDLTELQTAMSAQGHPVEAEHSDYGLTVHIVYRQRPERPDALHQHIEADLGERRLLLSAQERAVLEQHLEKEIAANLQRMIQETEERVAAINAELYRRPTSTGVRYRLEWQVVPDDDENAATGLAEARKRLLRTRAEAWSADDRQQVGEFLQARIAAERLRDEQASLPDSLARALDYRRWHRFRVQRLQDGTWKPLSGPASSGERALGLTVPLFAAASSHYQSAHAHAPRLVLMDEAFAGIDDEARASCMALIREFDLDFVMTSEREWGCYPALPGLSICQLVRREGMDAVYVSRWSWDGRERREEPDPARRFPETATSER